ncbi:hypothetical protein, partial [Shewanella chilikensis]|uniref:hypothetical protein n=1 Tax=Shewanella chilikensis TaxID=558541 RepID=UPI001F1C5DBA
MGEYPLVKLVGKAYRAKNCPLSKKLPGTGQEIAQHEKAFYVFIINQRFTFWHESCFSSNRFIQNLFEFLKRNLS